MTDAVKPCVDMISAVAVHFEVETLIDQFQRSNPITVDVRYDVNPNVAKRIVSGEAFELGLTNPWYVEEMIAAGIVRADSHVPFARTPLAIGRRGPFSGGLASSQESIRALLLDARSIGYTSEGTSGKIFSRAIEQLQLTDQISTRLMSMGAGQAVIAAAAGDIELAVAPLSRIIAAPGVEPIAVFPSDLKLDIDMSLFMSIGIKDTHGAKQLIDFLTDPSHDSLLASRGVTRFLLPS